MFLAGVECKKENRPRGSEGKTGEGGQSRTTDGAGKGLKLILSWLQEHDSLKININKPSHLVTLPQAG